MSLLSRLERRVASLLARRPKGYEAFDIDGNPTIKSDLNAIDWLDYVMGLVRDSRGRKKEKESLRDALAQTAYEDGGGKLHQLAAAMLHGPVDTEKPPLKPPSSKRRA